MPYLNPAQIASFQSEGFLAIPNFADAATIAALRQGATEILHALQLDQLKIFTTENQTDVLDNYFLESADKVRCFFEEEAFDEQGQLKRDKHLSVNKIGHALHDLMEVFEKYSYQKAMLAIAQDLGLRRPQIVQSQYIFKQAEIGAKVNPHTDSTFIYTQPTSCLGAWLALEPATIQNGCLFFIPGSHEKYPLQELYIRNNEGTGTTFMDTEAARVSWPVEELQPLEVAAGTLVLLSGEVIHASMANRSAHSRQSYILHMVDGECQWSVQNWLQRPADWPFRDMEKVASQQ